MSYRVRKNLSSKATRCVEHLGIELHAEQIQIQLLQSGSCSR